MGEGREGKKGLLLWLTPTILLYCSRGTISAAGILGCRCKTGTVTGLTRRDGGIFCYLITVRLRARVIFGFIVRVATIF